MFTGIIQHIGRVERIEEQEFGDLRLIISSPMDLSDTPIGASIACSGCCLTVVDKVFNESVENCFSVDVSRETLSKTIIDQWIHGSRVNIEPSLRLGDELGGHLVSGHVDGLAHLVSCSLEGDSRHMRFKIPRELAPFVASKGSVSLDGISLTINEVDDVVFGVNIISHTWDFTTLSDREIGDNLNIEIDMLARYVARMMDYKGSVS